jgi:hypothetical protein
MTKRSDKPRRRLTSDDSFDLAEARDSYISMPLWQRLALWFVLGVILLGILGDLIW